MDAQRVAARRASGLRPTQADVDHYSDLLALARTADLRFSDIHDHSIWALDALVVLPSRQSIDDAWRAGSVLTGQEDIDGIMSAAGIVSVAAEGSYYRLQFASPVPTSKLINLITSIVGIDNAAQTVATMDMDGNNVHVLDSSHVRFAVRFGDCLVGCIWEHHWVVQIDELSGRAEVIEEGGDPIPQP